MRPFRKNELRARGLARQTLEQVCALAITSFPQVILPNKLLQELSAVFDSADSSWSSLLGRMTCGNEVMASAHTCSSVCRASPRAPSSFLRNGRMASTHGSSSNRTWCCSPSSSSERRRRNAA